MTYYNSKVYYNIKETSLEIVRLIEVDISREFVISLLQLKNNIFH